jgi:hypothetical protein
VPQGAPSAKAKEFEHEFDYANDKYVQSFFADVESIVFSTDNDAPGIVLRNQLALIFGKERCKYIQYPSGYKDINDVFKGSTKADVLLPALGKAGVDECYANLASFPLKGIIRPQDVRAELELIASDGFTKGLGIGQLAIDELFTLKRKILTVITGLPGCFGKDQLIHTSQGVIPISQIKKGDKVLTFNHKRHKNEYKYVIDTPHHQNHPGKLYKITLMDGTEIVVTENHKFFTGQSYVQIKELLLSLENKLKK